MSIKNSTLPYKENTAGAVSTGKVSLNEIVNESMRQLQARHPGTTMVLRCEDLPECMGYRQELADLFEMLIGLIVLHQSAGSRLYLYINCETFKAEEAGGGQETVLLKFHTNISTGENWKLVNSQVLTQCKIIISHNHGTLQVNQINGAGCLFSVSLPGKSQ